MSRFKNKPTVLARLLDDIVKSISIRFEDAIEAAARRPEGLWMQPQYLPVRVRADADRRTASYHRDRSSIG